MLLNFLVCCFKHTHFYDVASVMFLSFLKQFQAFVFAFSDIFLLPMLLKIVKSLIDNILDKGKYVDGWPSKY